MPFELHPIVVLHEASARFITKLIKHLLVRDVNFCRHLRFDLATIYKMFQLGRRFGVVVHADVAKVTRGVARAVRSLPQ